MRTSTRLILLLTVMVSAVVAVTSFVSLRQREVALDTAMRNELRAHALTLQIALEENYGDGRITDAQRLIDRLRENTRIYGVVLFDQQARVVMLTNPLIPEEVRNPPELNRVLTTGQAVESVNHVNGQDVFSVIMPIRVGTGLRGAFEISQQVSSVKNDIARARRNWVVATLIIIFIIFGVVIVVMRRGLSHPIQELLGGAAALGQGDLDYRVIVPKGRNEFAQLAREFNRMADHLAAQRRAAAREAEERLALERDLRHSERLAMVGRLAAGVAHEMGVPLNVIDARAGQLLERPEAPLETRQRNLTIIRAQGERITRIVRQLLNLARSYNLRRQLVYLPSLISNTLEQIDAAATREGVEVELMCSEQIVVDADPDFLGQVLLNVLVNGIHAMPSGGRLRIECAAAAAEKEARRFAAVRVSDTGVGITPEHLDHIFDPFYTTREVGHGTGLGLTVARRIVEEHGGWIEAANNAGGGATFTIYLPQREELPGSLAAQPDQEKCEAR